METLTRTEINQANAQHSTGPTTEEGKKISSQNALRHGLTAQTVVLPTEDLTAYQAHLKSFQDEYSPKGSTESQLVQALADTSWRLNRVAVLENELLDSPRDPNLPRFAYLESQAKLLLSYSMHTQRLSRLFEKTVTHLRDLQQTRREQEQKHAGDLLDIREMYEAKGKTYIGTEHGFVFSHDELQDAIALRNRQVLAGQALEYFKD